MSWTPEWNFTSEDVVRWSNVQLEEIERLSLQYVVTDVGHESGRDNDVKLESSNYVL